MMQCLGVPLQQALETSNPIARVCGFGKASDLSGSPGWSPDVILKRERGRIDLGSTTVFGDIETR